MTCAARCAFMDIVGVRRSLTLGVVCIIDTRPGMLMLYVVMCSAGRGCALNGFDRDRVSLILDAKGHGRRCIALEGHCKQNEPQQ